MRTGVAWIQSSLLNRVVVLLIAAMLLTQGPAEGASPEVIRSGPGASGGVALTFDDGWDIDACAIIARTLRRENVVGTFFINGAILRRNPVRWRKIIGEMPVANHTVSHRNLAREPGPEIRRQIAHNETAHRQVLGRPPLKILRPPYGAYDPQVLRIAKRLGYRVVTWSVSTADTSPAATVRTITRRARSGRPGSIILMHCNNELTPRALPAIIRNYKARGIRLIGLDEMLGLDPLAQPSPVELIKPILERYALNH